jgi:recombination DNA repair RAD52 pathway protein
LYGDDANVNDDQNNRVDNSVDNTVQIDDNNNDSQHPAKRRKTVDGQSETQNHEKIDNPDSDSAKKSNFKDLVEKFKVKEKVDSPVDSDLAEFLIIIGIVAIQ